MKKSFLLSLFAVCALTFLAAPFVQSQDEDVADEYDCELVGQYSVVDGMQEGESYDIEEELVEVTVGKTTDIGETGWALSIKEKRDGGESYIQLSVLTPYAHVHLKGIAEIGSMFIGASTYFENGAPMSTSIEVVCIKLDD